MTDYAYPNLTVHGRLAPLSPADQARNAEDPSEQILPAFELGVEIQGVFVPFFRKRSVGGLIADIERSAADARAQASAPATAPPAEPPPAPPEPPPSAPVE